jgi:hypothetical protein
VRRASCHYCRVQREDALTHAHARGRHATHAHMIAYMRTYSHVNGVYSQVLSLYSSLLAADVRRACTRTRAHRARRTSATTATRPAHMNPARYHAYRCNTHTATVRARVDVVHDSYRAWARGTTRSHAHESSRSTLEYTATHSHSHTLHAPRAHARTHVCRRVRVYSASVRVLTVVVVSSSRYSLPTTDSR